MAIWISCPRSILNGFKAVALTAFPKERYAVLFGHFKKGGIEVKDIWHPEGQAKFCKSDGLLEDITSRKAWLTTAHDIAESEGLELVGDIHSHPYAVASSRCHETDSAPSQQDWRTSSKSGFPAGGIMGICLISKSPGQTKISISFWPQIPRVMLRLT